MDAHFTTLKRSDDLPRASSAPAPTPLTRCGGAIADKLDSKRWMLRDGTALTLRALQPGDRQELGIFFDRLSDQSRYQRFFFGAPAISEELLDLLVIDQPERRMAFVVLGPDGSDIVAEGSIVIGPPDEAEVALTVSDFWQGRGIGFRLLRHLMDTATACGVRVVKAEFLSENRRIVGLLRDAQFDFHRQPGDGIVGRARLESRASGATRAGQSTALAAFGTS